MYKPTSFFTIYVNHFYENVGLLIVGVLNPGGGDPPPPPPLPGGGGGVAASPLPPRGPCGPPKVFWGTRRLARLTVGKLTVATPRAPGGATRLH